MWLDNFGRTEQQDKEFFSQLGKAQVSSKPDPGLFTGTGDALLYAAPNAFYNTLSGLEDFSAVKLSQMYELPDRKSVV